MNKKVETICKFAFYFAAYEAVIVFLVVIPHFVLEDLGWFGTVIRILCLMTAISDFRKNKKKKRNKRGL